MFKALGKTWMKRQKQPGYVFSETTAAAATFELARQCQCWEGAECQREGGKGLAIHPAATLGLAPSWELCICYRL